MTFLKKEIGVGLIHGGAYYRRGGEGGINASEFKRSIFAGFNYSDFTSFKWSERKCPFCKTEIEDE